MVQASKQQFWLEQIRDFRASGLSRLAFCRERGYSVWSLRYWEKRLNDPLSKAPAKARRQTNFAAVTVRAAFGKEATPFGSPVVRLRLSAGAEIEIDQLPPANWMSDVILQLQRGEHRDQA